jgi:hypothetical protein
MYEHAVPGRASNLHSTGYPDHGRCGDLLLQEKIPTAEPGIETGTPPPSPRLLPEKMHVSFAREILTARTFVFDTEVVKSQCSHVTGQNVPLANTKLTAFEFVQRTNFWVLTLKRSVLRHGETVKGRKGIVITYTLYIFV